MKIIVTGATGWLGREFISWYLNNVSGAEKEDLILLASRETEFEIHLLGKFKTHYMTEDFSTKSIVGIVHLAFVLRHRVQEFGIDSFLELNRQITDKAVDLVIKYKPKWVINVSSGAIFDRPSLNYATDSSINPYGFMKRREELALIEASEKVGSNLVIGRLWGASGFYMPINQAYALSDFIYTGIQEREIRLISNHPVLRRYGDAGQFMGILYRHAQRESLEILDSGGDLVELGDLAELISNFLGTTSINRPDMINHLRDDYYPHSNRLEELAKRYEISLFTLAEQVERTIKGHQNQLGFPQMYSERES